MPVHTAATGKATAPARSIPGPRQRRLNFRRSRFVAVMKVLLPGLAVALLALVATWPSLRHVEDALRVDFDRAAMAAAGPRMVYPRLLGVDDADQPFTVTADSAARMPGTGKREVYELVQPKADTTLKDGSWWVLSASQGVLWRDRQQLDMTGDVSLFQDQGFEFATSKARVDLVKRTARGDAPIHGQGPYGLIDADGFTMQARGGVITFTGKARLTLYGTGRAEAGVDAP